MKQNEKSNMNPKSHIIKLMFETVDTIALYKVWIPKKSSRI